MNSNFKIINLKISFFLEMILYKMSYTDYKLTYRNSIYIYIYFFLVDFLNNFSLTIYQLLTNSFLF